MYDLTIALAAIRTYNWKRLYDSIVQSIGDYTFELIFCGPDSELPDELKNKENVKLIQDFGSPTRAQQIASLASTGRYTTWAADDGWYLPNKLKECLDILDNMNDEKKALLAFYQEDKRAGLANYSCNFHEPIRSPYYGNEYLVFNCAIVQTEYFKQLGGFDCCFEVLPMAFTDYGVRSHRDNVTVHVFEENLFECTHTPGTSGDHAPIHHAQLEHDQPLYGTMYNNPSCIDRIKIDADNWKNSPDVWKRRF